MSHCEAKSVRERVHTFRGQLPQCPDYAAFQQGSDAWAEGGAVRKVFAHVPQAQGRASALMPQAILLAASELKGAAS